LCLASNVRSQQFLLIGETFAPAPHDLPAQDQKACAGGPHLTPARLKEFLGAMKGVSHGPNVGIAYASNETNYCPRCQTEGELLADRSSPLAKRQHRYRAATVRHLAKPRIWPPIRVRVRSG